MAPASTDFTWTGLGDPTDWTDVSNWDVGTAPTSSDHCIIPTSPAGGNFPQLAIGGNCNNLTINTGAEFDINAPVTISVAGDFQEGLSSSRTTRS